MQVYHVYYWRKPFKIQRFEIYTFIEDYERLIKCWKATKHNKNNNYAYAVDISR